MTEIEAKNKVTTTALGEVGYKETGKNITKYSAYFEGTDFYNGSKGDGKTWGAEWCDIFNDWCFAVVFGNEMAKKMLYQGSKSAGAGCKNSADFYKKNNAFYSTPEYGDQIFFYVGGEINHTGRVVGVSDTIVMTVEGNSNNMVQQKTYDRKNTKIAGYGRPDWSVVADVPTPAPTPTPIGGKCTVELDVLQLGSKGEQVKTLQRLLKELGYKGKPVNGKQKELTIDGDAGQNTIYALKTAQRAWGMKDDGICGQKSWTRLLKG